VCVPAARLYLFNPAVFCYPVQKGSICSLMREGEGSPRLSHYDPPFVAAVSACSASCLIDCRGTFPSERISGKLEELLSLRLSLFPVVFFGDTLSL